MLQGSEEWLKARCGSVGSSDAPRVVRRTQSGFSADRAKLMAEKVLERVTGVPFQRFKTAAMQQGLDREPDARALYAIVRNVEVEEIDLIRHPLIVGSHCSPDGLVGELGLVEIKCPEPAAHLATLLTEEIPADYQVQMMWQMACAGREWCDYVSFNPDFPTEMSLWIKRVPRVETHIRDLEGEVRGFIKELGQKVEKLGRRYERAA